MVDTVLPRADQEIAGELVDTEGKPVVGARIFARAMFADPALRARTKTSLTDAHGRFRLSGLPRGDAVVYRSFDQFDNRQTMLGQATAGADDLRFAVPGAEGSPTGDGPSKSDMPSAK